MNIRLEKRLSPRRHTQIAARIAFNGYAKDCIIRNVSDTGAKLEVLGVAHIPNSFELLTVGHRPQPCRVVWRALREIGIEFTAPAEG